jgi:hypothetical protein
VAECAVVVLSCWGGPALQHAAETPSDGENADVVAQMLVRPGDAEPLLKCAWASSCSGDSDFAVRLDPVSMEIGVKSLQSITRKRPI